MIIDKRIRLVCLLIGLFLGTGNAQDFIKIKNRWQ